MQIIIDDDHCNECQRSFTRIPTFICVFLHCMSILVIMKSLIFFMPTEAIYHSALSPDKLLIYRKPKRYISSLPHDFHMSNHRDQSRHNSPIIPGRRLARAHAPFMLLRWASCQPASQPGFLPPSA